MQILSGNKQVATAVGSGQIAFGLTDTDDAMGEIDAGSPVAIVYPDREPDQLGTLFIPNTLALIKGAPHPEAAEALADHLLSPEVEAALARGPSAQIPLLNEHDDVARGSRRPGPSTPWRSTSRPPPGSGTGSPPSWRAASRDDGTTPSDLARGPFTFSGRTPTNERGEPCQP